MITIKFKGCCLLVVLSVLIVLVLLARDDIQFLCWGFHFDFASCWLCC